MAAEVEVNADIRGGFQLRRRWRGIARLAARQHGIVSRSQLLGAGAGPRQIDRLVNARQLHPIHRGVYAVGHRLLTPEGRWAAAVLAGGDGAVLSHESAAMNWQLLNRYPVLPSVTAPVKVRRQGESPITPPARRPMSGRPATASRRSRSPARSSTLPGSAAPTAWNGRSPRPSTAATPTFESDRLRDRRLSVIGMRPVRITWRQLESDPDAVEADLRAIGVRDRLGA